MTNISAKLYIDNIKYVFLAMLFLKKSCFFTIKKVSTSIYKVIPYLYINY